MMDHCLNCINAQSREIKVACHVIEEDLFYLKKIKSFVLQLKERKKEGHVDCGVITS